MLIVLTQGSEKIKQIIEQGYSDYHNKKTISKKAWSEVKESILKPPLYAIMKDDVNSIP